MAADRRVASVRARTTAAATAVVGVALVLASVALVVFLRRSLTEDVRLAARLRAEAVANLLDEAGPPELGSDDDEFVQVLDPSGAVVLASPNVGGDRPLVRHAPGEDERLQVPFDDDPFLAVGVPAEGGGTVVVGRTLDVVVESTQAVVALLLLGVPLLLALVALVTRGVVGRALAPVEAMRAEVETISTAELHRRVPVPSTGDEISRLARTMNRMLERLERGQERQRRFVSDASHELRSPVASIRQHAELALSHPSRVSPEDLARVVLDEDLRVQRLVEDLLLLARMDEGEDVPAKEVDLDDVVLDEVARQRAVGDAEVDVSGVSAGRVIGDPRRLARLVANLLENAIRHARRRVAVSLVEEEAEVLLTVDDDGPGIPPEERQRVFERFVRLEAARDRDSGGSGLGLAIVAEVASLHGGVVTADGSPLGGARLQVRLPRAG